MCVCRRVLSAEGGGVCVQQRVGVPVCVLAQWRVGDLCVHACSVEGVRRDFSCGYFLIIMNITCRRFHGFLRIVFMWQ